ncbi:MAG: phosphate regulon sensor histidine kinase PhoR [Methylophilaceae bacterium]|nr:phosphate regulon sensor histidine kinase PhoR [Methylophilaceae bacterium]
MQDFWWRTTWPLLPAALISLILWPTAGAHIALAVLCAAMLLLLLKHLFQLRQLMTWLKRPDLEAFPWGSGIWEDVFASLYQELRRHVRNETQLISELERLRQAARALPDGVVMLNENDQIEWCNPIAERLLGLRLEHDAHQPISYLLRQTEFSEYLNARNYATPLMLKLSRNPDMTLELQLVPFGVNRKLLICRDITHLEKIETMRRDFVANVSHELRTPLTVISGFLETLKDIEGAVPETIRHYFDLMETQANRMRNLVNDLLTLSRLESSPTPAQEKEIDVDTLLEHLHKEALNLSGGRHCIILDGIEPGLHLIGSEEEIHSAFSNLVNNAIRYTPDGGEIRLSWKLRGQEAVFSVQDTGIGIEPQHIPRLTERFYRVDRARSRETGGTGLGLSIVKHILTRHQARLEISSDYGKGSTFSAVFPRDRIVRSDH